MITTSVINRKGGVGKTTTIINLAWHLSNDHGYKVLLIDADSQGNLTDLCGMIRNASITICDVLVNTASLEKGIRKTKYPQIYVLPGDERLESMHDISENALMWALDEVKDEYDFCFIDCPASMQISTVNALIASDYVIAPMKLDGFSQKGVLAMDRLVTQCTEYNEKLVFLGALITMYRSNKSTNKMIVDIVESSGMTVMETVISYDPAAERVLRNKKPFAKGASRGKAAADYKALAEEFLSEVHYGRFED